MCWVKENRWGPGAASPFGRNVGVGVSVSAGLNFGIVSSAGKKGMISKFWNKVGSVSKRRLNAILY